MPSPAWSYSAITSFEQCPLQYKLTRVDKVVSGPESDAIVWGKRVHKHLEERIRDGKKLPDILRNLEPVAASIANAKGEVLVEQQWCLNENLQPTTWFGKDAWCRAVIDVGVIGSKSAAIFDWKTGKRKDDLDQLKLFAGIAFTMYPHLEKVKTGFVWTKDSSIDKEEFTRDQVGEIWAAFLPRVERLKNAFETGKWQAKPSGLCAKWCPVGKSNCEFCGS
jgi:hypothetical protein